MTVLLDGPMGTELIRRGVPCPEPGWSAEGLSTHPQAVQQLHRDYVSAGATLHRSCTFRTQPHRYPASWRDRVHAALRLAREVLPPDQQLLGVLAPLEDCYRPDRSPAQPGPAHRLLADELSRAGADGLLCETFPHPGEGLTALSACLETGLPSWLALTPGYDGSLMSPELLLQTAREAVRRGASCVLVNCCPAERALGYIRPLAEAGIPFGIYANAGPLDGELGWGHPEGPARYAELAAAWMEWEPAVLGVCCGGSPGHVSRLRDLLTQL